MTTPRPQHRQVARDNPATQRRRSPVITPRPETAGRNCVRGVSRRTACLTGDRRSPLSDVIRSSRTRRLDREVNRIGVSFIRLPIYQLPPTDLRDSRTCVGRPPVAPADVLRAYRTHRIQRGGNRFGVSFICLPTTTYRSTIYHLPIYHLPPTAIHANDTAQARPVTLISDFSVP